MSSGHPCTALSRSHVHIGSGVRYCSRPMRSLCVIVLAAIPAFLDHANHIHCAQIAHANACVRRAQLPFLLDSSHLSRDATGMEVRDFETGESGYVRLPRACEHLRFSIRTPSVLFPEEAKLTARSCVDACTLTLQLPACGAVAGTEWPPATAWRLLLCLPSYMGFGIMIDGDGGFSPRPTTISHGSRLGLTSSSPLPKHLPSRASNSRRRHGVLRRVQRPHGVLS